MIAGFDAPMGVQTPQAFSASILRGVAPSSDHAVRHPRAIQFTTDDSIEFVRPRLEGAIGRPLSGKAVWVRLHRADGSSGVLIGLHSYVSPGEMEIIVVANPDILSRTVFRFVTTWAFLHLGLQRVVARIPEGAHVHADLLHRAGFQREAILGGFLADGSNAALWSMTRGTCPWLPSTPAPAAATGIPTHSSLQVH